MAMLGGADFNEGGAIVRRHRDGDESAATKSCAAHRTARDRTL